MFNIIDVSLLVCRMFTSSMALCDTVARNAGIYDNEISKCWSCIRARSTAISDCREISLCFSFHIWIHICFQELLDSLSDLYKLLAETDMFQAVWTRRCYHEETSRALAYAQHGLCSQTIKVLELAMDGMQKRLSIPSTIGDASSTNGANNNSITLPLIAEMNLWEEEWIRATKELNQWDTLKEFANSNAVQVMNMWWIIYLAINRIPACWWNVHGVYRIGCWWKKHLHKSNRAHRPNTTGKCISIAQCCSYVNRTIERRRPSIDVSKRRISSWLPIGVNYRLSYRIVICRYCRYVLYVVLMKLDDFQAAHLIQEVAEAGQVGHSLSCAGPTPQPTIINEVKSIIKTWR